MDSHFLTISEAAKRASEDEFLQNVKRNVISRLIEKGVLSGRNDGRRQLVADDDALARTMRLGVESFIYNQQGYSFTAVRAPIDAVAARLKVRPCVVGYEERVEPRRLEGEVGLEPDANRRHSFLVQTRKAPETSVLIQTVHWFHSCDAVMATALACALSHQFETIAAAAWDDDFSGPSLIVCEDGERSQTISDASDEEEGGGTRFYEFFYEHGLYLPQMFIGGRPDAQMLYVADPAEIKRADCVVLRLPAAAGTQPPHLFEKLGLMAEAMAAGLDDELAFMDHMYCGLWDQAQALLASGEF